MSTAHRVFGTYAPASDPVHGGHQALSRFIAYFETLSQSSLDDIARIYAPNARFRDPFNNVQGLDAVRRVFVHMFAVTEAPRFVVLDALGNTAQGFVVWNFNFRGKGRAARDWVIHGATRLEFDAQGLVTLHRDYWDAAEELYEHLFMLGPFLRTIKKRLQAD